ncbi:MAG: hypothetical protein M3459_10620 [Actinomycetota bacterium]|nr:hypothetical protein [Actinomycetota bacterium]
MPRHGCLNVALITIVVAAVGCGANEEDAPTPPAPDARPATSGAPAAPATPEQFAACVRERGSEQGLRSDGETPLSVTGVEGGTYETAAVYDAEGLLFAQVLLFAGVGEAEQAQEAILEEGFFEGTVQGGNAVLVPRPDGNPLLEPVRACLPTEAGG